MMMFGEGTSIHFFKPESTHYSSTWKKDKIYIYLERLFAWEFIPVVLPLHPYKMVLTWGSNEHMGCHIISSYMHSCFPRPRVISYSHFNISTCIFLSSNLSIVCDVTDYFNLNVYFNLSK